MLRGTVECLLAILATALAAVVRWWLGTLVGQRLPPSITFYPLIPVVIFTSSSNVDDIQRAYDLGAAGYLTKLPNPSHWGTHACAFRDFWLEHNTPPPVGREAG